MSQAASNSSPYSNSGLFSGYYLEDRIDDLDEWECDDEAEAAFAKLNDLWESEGDLLPSYKENELLGSWIDKILDVLGYATLQETTLPGGEGYNDRLLFESMETRREGSRRKQEGNVEAMYGLSSAILEAKQYDSDFNTKFDEQRSYHDASHQIRYYLDRAGSEVDWGILTNGKEWRLYGTKDYATEIYYEVDLVDLLKTGNIEEFKYFYAFFRPDAFRETAGTTFLDTVWNESETAAQELGEDLQDNVFTALRVLGEGFVETNDLEIGSEDGADIEASELKEQSLVLLYRLMFVLYAESRGLMQPDDPEREAEYDENFCLDQLRLEIDERISSGDSYEDYSQYSTTIWGQLQDLFLLVDSGNDNLGVPPYNGGLFDAEEHEFLANNEVADPYITEVIHRLGTTENDDGELVLADYADLDTRHLGTIYEGLLEHEFRIAPEQYAAVSEDGGQVWKPATEVNVADAVESVDEGSLYVVNDDGERKATGAYYTPDYVVSYIVEETIDPLLDEIKAKLEADGLEPSDQAYFGRFYSQLLDLKILDPAMGSAHFLTNATGYLTEQVMEIVREQELQGRNEQELRRTIAKECIYGVDINGMAVELGKLSMWLETLAADKPLAFLDHHIKTGNSLVGSDITEVLSDDTEENGGQLTLRQALTHTRQQTLEHVMDLMEELLAIENEDLADIKSMEELYDEIRDDPLYQRLFEIANVHTAEEFALDIPEDAYEEMAGAIEDEVEWGEIREQDWFRTAQVMADDEGFFHWELEFPEVFFDENGRPHPEDGFDAIVGNPPYVSNWNLTESDPELVDALHTMYSDIAVGHWDLYIPFCYRALTLLAEGGQHSFITSNSISKEKYGRSLRETIVEDYNMRKLVRFGETEVFEGVNRMVLIYVVENSKTKSDKLSVVEGTDIDFNEQGTLLQQSLSNFSDYAWRLDIAEADMMIKSKVENAGIALGHLCWVNPGVVAHSAEDSPRDFVKDDVLVNSPKPGAKKYVAGGDVSRHHIDWKGMYMEYEKYEEHFHRPKDPVLFESPKIMFSDVSGGNNRVKSCYDNSGYYSNHTLNHATKWTEETRQFQSPSDYSVHEEVDKFDLRFVAGLVNSALISYYFAKFHATKSLQSDRTRMHPEEIRSLPIFDISESMPDELQIGFGEEASSFESQSSDNQISELTEDIIELSHTKGDLNLSLRDHLGSYSDGQSLADIGLTQPPTGAADSILQATNKTYPYLRVGTANVVRESSSTVEVQFTARYKPEELAEDVSGPVDDRESDQYGYVETDPETALRITDLTEREADLIEAFVPFAVDEAGGFADFRETATKTNSLVDRLHKLTLPAVSDVETGLKSYTQTKERAEELEAKIEQTDELIDEIVYELYGLTDEEIEIVEEAVST